MTLKNNNFEINCLLQFNADDAINAEICKNILKYLIFFRSQIPDPYSDLLNRKSKLENNETKQTLGQKKEPISRQLYLQNTENKKIINYIKEMEMMFQTLDEYLLRYPISQVVFSFGGNILAPKEYYVINLPSFYCKDCTVLSQALLKQRMVSIHQELFKTKFFDAVKSLNNSRMFVLISCPSDIKIINNSKKIDFYKFSINSKSLQINIENQECFHCKLNTSDMSPMDMSLDENMINQKIFQYTESGSLIENLDHENEIVPQNESLKENEISQSESLESAFDDSLLTDLSELSMNMTNQLVLDSDNETKVDPSKNRLPRMFACHVESRSSIEKRKIAEKTIWVQVANSIMF